jgi:hypothetical protein
MRLTLVLFTLLAANPGLAHVGHLADVAGHGHWAAAGAIAIALGIAALGARNGKKAEDARQEDATTDEKEALA